MWVTEIIAISPKDGELKKYGGPNVPGFTIEHARQYCEENGLGYYHVIGELVAEISQEGEEIHYDSYLN